MPWENARSPLTDSAHNTFMGIDYLRIYRPKSELDTSVSQRCNQVIDRQGISLDKPIDLSLDGNCYFSFLINKRRKSKVSVVLSSERGRISTFTVEENNALSLKNSEVAVSTETAHPGRTRTCDLRIRNPLQDAVTPCKQRTPKNDLTHTRQNHEDVASENPDLARIMEIWPSLSGELRKAIVKMIT